MHVLAYLKAKCSIPCQIMTLMEQFAFEFQLWFDKVILNVITSSHLLGHHRARCGCAGHWNHYCCFLSECQNSGPGHIKASVLGPGSGVLVCSARTQSTIKPNTKRLVQSPLLLKTSRLSPACRVRKIFMILVSLMSCKPEKEPNKNLGHQHR